MDGQFSLTQHRDSDRVLVTVAGELDAATVPQLREMLDAIIATHAGSAVIDLSGVTFMDSTGIHALFDAKTTAKASPLELVLSSPSACVERLTDIVGLRDILFGPQRIEA
jgi:anti-anti-sigma factor